MTKNTIVDFSVLYPYFDNLIKEEINYHPLDLPSCLNKDLKNIYDLFNGVLELTLADVKKLYFKRKMSKSSVNDKNNYLIKKAKNLCIGDRVSLSFDSDNILTITSLIDAAPDYIRLEWLNGFYRTCDKELEVQVLID